MEAISTHGVKTISLTHIVLSMAGMEMILALSFRRITGKYLWEEETMMLIS